MSEIENKKTKSLAQLLEKLEYTCVKGDVNVPITQVVYDSRKVEEGCLFICIKGATFDGHTKAFEAAEKSAAALLVMDDVDVPIEGITIIKVENTRKAMAYVSASWFDYPAEKLTTIGITGTKGKTTTTYLVKSILENAGFKVGLVGTIEIITGAKARKAVNTTPESYLLQEYFSEMVENGVQIVVMEVSSQGLMMHRTDGFIFDYGIFTNMSPDHIGPNEHSSFEDYMACKGLLFKQCKVGIVNGDDKHLDTVIEGHTCTIETYGLNEGNDTVAENIQLVHRTGYMGVEFDVKGLSNIHIEACIPGKFSVFNILTTVAICRHFNVSESDQKKAFKMAKVKGRTELVKIAEDIFFIIDYAHNAIALESVLTTLREYEPKRIVTIFGCGGNRSRDRRFDMGEVSGKLSDLTIITSDNPRFEEPLEIMADIEVGIQRTEGEYIQIVSRKDAVEYAIRHAKEGDLILLAGKGHEDYQEIKGVKYPMDERELISQVLESGVKVGELE